MRRRTRVFVAVGIAALGAIGGSTALVAGAQGQDPTPGVKGDFSLIMMIHTQQSVPEFNVPATSPWDGARRPGIFTYRSIPCTGNAPVNNISSDLPSYNTRVPGSRSPSSLRAHPFAMRIKKARGGGWELQGQIDFTVCKLGPGPTVRPEPVADEQKPKIRVRYRAKFLRATAENVHWAGRFRIVGGTGRYEGLTGTGDIAGYFFCFEPQGCQATGGRYQDGQMVMHGDYEDPTPRLDQQGLR